MNPYKIDITIQIRVEPSGYLPDYHNVIIDMVSGGETEMITRRVPNTDIMSEVNRLGTLTGLFIDSLKV